MKKYILIALMLLLPGILLSQAEKEKEKGPVKLKMNIPVLSQYSNNFAIKTIDFNKRTDLGGKGELLEVAFQLENLSDDPVDLYIFTIATFEKKEITKSSFERPIPAKEKIRTFVPYPDDISNFSYADVDKDGNVMKDKNGLEVIKFEKFPKNPKAGIDAETGKPYHLVDRLHIRTTHLSKYRRNYFYFNNLAVLIFDTQGNPVFRQLFTVKGKRNR
jgi:hypothetical protein